MRYKVKHLDQVTYNELKRKTLTTLSFLWAFSSENIHINSSQLFADAISFFSLFIRVKEGRGVLEVLKIRLKISY